MDKWQQMRQKNPKKWSPRPHRALKEFKAEIADHY